MGSKVNEAELNTMVTLFTKGCSKRSIARLLGLDEKTVRYHLQRHESGAVDGRRAQELHLVTCGLDEAAAEWWHAHSPESGAKRPPSIQELHAYLQASHGYRGSYKSVRKWVRRRYRPPKIRSYRRVETPPGAQAQIDWKEDVSIDIGGPDGPEPLQAFVMQLGHSRAMAVVWSYRKDQLSWQHCHNEAFKRLGGVPAVGRVDNCPTAIATGSGCWGTITSDYRRYALAMRFHVDACQARSPNAKGKVERTVSIISGLGIFDKCYESLAHLQAYTDEKVAISQRHRLCPATGTPIAEAHAAERRLLHPLPERLPEPFDLVRTLKVHKDCMVHFEGRQYELPFTYVGLHVEGHGCHDCVQFVDLKSGEVIRQYPRHTQERILLDPTCSEGESDDRVMRPIPLGKMGRRLAEIYAMPVELRPTDLYAALAEVAR